ncbi:MAG: anti-sigma factor [candidate division NC10 bacterium]|nr:anti-sigma factor [candidate division NC10 bacterium]
MTCEELRDRYALYAVGALPPEEREPLEEHLARGCPTCTAGVGAFEQVASLLAYDAAAKVPPPVLRERVLARAAPGQQATAPAVRRRPTWGLAAAWAAAALVAVAGLTYGLTLRGQVREQAALIRGLHVRLAEHEDLMAIMTDPCTRIIRMVGAEPVPPPEAQALWNQQRGMRLFAVNLPPLAEGESYWLWVKTATDMVPAAAFSPDARGSARLTLTGLPDLSTARGLAVTRERIPVAHRPAGPILMAGAL